MSSKPVCSDCAGASYSAAWRARSCARAVRRRGAQSLVWRFLTAALPDGAKTPVRSLAFSADGHSLAAVNHEGLVSIWPIMDFEVRIFITSESVPPLQTYAASLSPSTGRRTAGNFVTTYSPNGTWLATGHQDGKVRLRDPLVS